MQYTDQLASRALMAATAMFAANFSVWTLYAVLGVSIGDQLGLSATEFGVLLAAPMLSGALLRFPLGLLVERFSAKKLIVLQMLLVVPILVLLPHIHSYRGYLLAGLWLGISGTSFVAGIRYISPWFEGRQQGTAMGIFGAGNAGAAITLALAPAIESWLGQDMIGPLYGAGLFAMAILFALWAPEETRYMRSRRRTDFDFHLRPLAELRVWRFGLYYYFVFGSFLALLLWLPQYYLNVYGVSTQKAMALTLLFVAVSSSVRALGGWFADRYGARAVNWSVFWTCLVCLFFLSYPPTSMTIHGVDRDVHLNIEVGIELFTLLILVIGIAQGFGRASVYKIVYDKYPQHMGSVGGAVATLGALGGFSLPVLFGMAQDIVGIHSAAFMLLYGVLAACMLVMYLTVQRERVQQRVTFARQHNFLLDD
ncbi:MFS transporter, NNP family, nitrate/nitrite transporter [Microbulbifer donghaiensis]|uniref:MFS transporter, NNP family, nitrate/nitrite transporter n=1 Tax=Microbulbifer donghaiensis TaxID=494016 RepID=A0A1M4YQJ8_9GAMM|nr:MFS transporter [Microbulbifer donghaiensis]SHF07963.1 MFS transporter, NNP family, nitrate/nitrite transporter [Microbulbifer donghaiensis]